MEINIPKEVEYDSLSLDILQYDLQKVVERFGGKFRSDYFRYFLDNQHGTQGSRNKIYEIPSVGQVILEFKKTFRDTWITKIHISEFDNSEDRDLYFSLRESLEKVFVIDSLEELNF